MTKNLANLFGCKVAETPLKYLGNPFKEQKTVTIRLGVIVDKINKKKKKASKLGRFYALYRRKETMINSNFSSPFIYPLHVQNA